MFDIAYANWAANALLIAALVASGLFGLFVAPRWRKAETAHRTARRRWIEDQIIGGRLEIRAGRLVTR